MNVGGNWQMNSRGVSRGVRWGRTKIANIREKRSKLISRKFTIFREWSWNPVICQFQFTRVPLGPINIYDLQVEDLTWTSIVHKQWRVMISPATRATSAVYFFKIWLISYYKLRRNTGPKLASHPHNPIYSHIFDWSLIILICELSKRTGCKTTDCTYWK